MPMNASDGPHYGLNLPKLDAGTYDVTSRSSPPAAGCCTPTRPRASRAASGTEPLVAEFPDWQWESHGRVLVIDSHASWGRGSGSCVGPLASVPAPWGDVDLTPES